MIIILNFSLHGLVCDSQPVLKFVNAMMNQFMNL